MGVTPSHHPFIDGIFPYKPSIGEYPHLWKPPNQPFRSQSFCLSEKFTTIEVRMCDVPRASGSRRGRPKIARSGAPHFANIDINSFSGNQTFCGHKSHFTVSVLHEFVKFLSELHASTDQMIMMQTMLCI